MVAEGAEPGESPPILATFVCFLRLGDMDESESQTNQQNDDGFPTHTCPVYFGSLPLVQSVFSCPLFIGYGIADSRVINPIIGTSDRWAIPSYRFGLEYS